MPDRYTGEIFITNEDYYPGDDEDDIREEDAAAEEPDPVFVVLWKNGHVSIHDEHWVSNAYDMTDCNSMDDVNQILATDQDKNLVPITLNDQYKINEDQECPLHFAACAIMAGTRRVGTVIYTDH